MDGPTVQTKDGRLKGRFMTSRNGSTYEAFIGIRYGVIPGRFEIAVPSPAWQGTKEATEFGAVCPQQILGSTRIVGEEDCLFLNVYTPKADGKKRSVLFFVHGGGFYFGSGDPYGAKYLMDEDIVLVTFNYRVGMLGFLNAQNGAASGNMGLKDQVLALKWVQKNIEAFGGDPSKVTIAGESAGGASVIHLIVSPTTKGLFRSAVSESGSALNPWAYKDSTLANAFIAGKHLKCNTDDPEELVKFLKEASLADLIGTQSLYPEWDTDPTIAFPPTLEITDERNPEPFLPDSPRNLFKAGKFNRVPLLLTVNKEEGSLLHAASLVRNPELLKDLNENWDRIAPITFLLRDDPELKGRNMTEIAQKIRKFYFTNQEITLEKEEQLTNLYTDSWFLYGVHETAVSMAKYAPVYTAVVTHRRKDFSPLSSQGITENLGVTTHAEELPYLYDPGNPECQVAGIMVPAAAIVEPDDIEFSKGFVKAIGSFVKTGIPEVTLGNSPKWNPLTKGETATGQLNWLSLDLQPKTLVNPFKDRMTFWESIYRNTP